MRRSLLAVARDEVLQHPLRTVLVSLAMALAVANSIVPASVILGSRARALERARELGTDRIEVSVDRTQGDQSVPRESDLPPLTEILGPDVLLTALRVRRASFREAGRPSVWLLGCDDQLGDTRGIALRAGRQPELQPADAPLEVAVEAGLARALDESGKPALGRVLYLERTGERAPRVTLTALPESRELHVVGVMEDDSRRDIDRFGNQRGKAFADDIARLARMFGLFAPSTPWLEDGHGIYVPRAEIPGDRIDAIFLRVDPPRVEEVSQQVEDALVARGRAPLVFTNTLAAILTRPELEGYLALHDVLFWVLLVIGLAVLMSLLLLSGWRRRREIALRRAEGASRGAIFGQFVWEGVIVSLVGLGVGVVLGMLLAWLRVELDPSVVMAVGWPWRVIFETTVILALGGIVASAYPAWKASGHHPMSLFRKMDVAP